jgi:hypothetical protein
MADLLELRRRSVGNTLEALKKAEVNIFNLIFNNLND